MTSCVKKVEEGVDEAYDTENARELADGKRREE